MELKLSLSEGLQPVPLEPEDYGKVDPRIYFIKRGGVAQRTPYKWPWMYEAKVQTYKAREFEQKSKRKDEEIQRLIEKVKSLESRIEKEEKEENLKKYKDAIFELDCLSTKQERELIVRGQEIKRLKEENESFKEERGEVEGKFKEKIKYLDNRVSCLGSENMDLRKEVENLKSKIDQYKKKELGIGEKDKVVLSLKDGEWKFDSVCFKGFDANNYIGITTKEIARKFILEIGRKYGSDLKCMNHGDIVLEFVKFNGKEGVI